MAEAGRAVVEFIGDYSKLNAGLASSLAPTKLGKMGKVGGLAIGGALAAAAGGAVVTKALYGLGKEFDTAFDRIRVGTGATGKRLEGLKKDFKGVAKEVPNDLSEVGDAIADLNQRLGLTGKPLQAMARNMLDLSRVTDTDLQGNIRAVSRAFVDWEVPVKRQVATLDGFYRISQKSGASVEELTSSVQKFGSPLRTLGFGIGEAASMFAIFERAGVNAQTMVPGFKLAIGNLVKPTDDLKGTLAELGVAAGDPEKGLRQIMDLLGNGSNLKAIEKISLAMDVFGKRAGADMAEAIRQGRFDLDSYVSTFKNGSDSIRKSVQETNDAGENLAIFFNKVKVALEPLGSFYYDLGSKISRGLATLDVSGYISTLAESTRKLVPLYDGIKGVLGLFGGGDDEVSGIKQIMQARVASVESLKKASERTVHARKRVSRATDAEREAERNLRNARKRFGDGSNEAIKAEIQLQRAKRKTIRVTEQAKKAERLEGIERQIASKRLRDQAVAEKARLGQLNRLIRVLNHRRNIEWKTNGDTQKLRDIEGKLTDKLKARSNTQKRLNNVLGDAATTIGPKFARSLKSISSRTAAMETALGHIPGKANNMRDALGKISPAVKRLNPVIKDVGDTSKKSMGKAGDAMSDYAKVTGDKRVTVNRNMKLMPVVQVAATDRMLEDFSDKMGLFKNDGKPQSKRRGGLIQHFRKGGVPVAVSPGEMYKTPDGKAGIVPGRPEPRDSVLTSMPVGTKIFTFDGQRQLAEGASEASALRSQRPHFAGGGIVRPTVTGGSPKARDLANTGIDSLHGLAGDRLKKAQAAMAAIGSGAEITNLVPQVKRALAYAKTHGWSGSVSSGWRSYAEQAQLYAAYLAGTGNLAAKPGTSNHEGGEAVDVTDPEGFAAAMNSLGAPDELFRYVSGEPWHFSATGHRRGGIIGAIQNFMRGGTAEHRVVKNVGADLLKHGFDFRATAGILGNAWREGLWNPKQREFADSSNGGLYGFTTSPVSLPDMISWAESSGKNPWDEVVQTHFMLTHGQPTGFAIKGALNSEDTIAGAAEYFMRNWERPNLSVAGLDERIGAGHDASKILRDAGITKPGDSTDGGGSGKPAGPSPTEKRRSERGGIIKKLQDALRGKSGTDRLGGLWDLVGAYAKYGKFEGNEKSWLLSQASTAAKQKSPVVAANALDRVRKTLGDLVEISGESGTNESLVERLKAVKAKGKESAAAKRDRAFSKIAKSGISYPFKDSLVGVDGQIALTAEMLSNAQRAAGFEGGPGGADLTEAERVEQVRLNETILASQVSKEGWLIKAIASLYKKETNLDDQMAKAAPAGSLTHWKYGALKSAKKAARRKIGELTESFKGLVGLTGKGGEMGETQFALKELGVASTVESASAAARDSELADLMREQLGLANRNNAILAAQTPVYEQFMPKYHTGGVIPGSGEKPIMAKGGEGVFTADQMAALGNGEIQVTVVVEDGAVDPNKIRTEAVRAVNGMAMRVRTGGPAAGRKYVTNG